MKKLLLLITIVLGATGLFAQMPPAGMRPAGNLSAHLYGKLTDNDGKAIGEATVLLMENKIDSVTKKTKQLLYKSVITQANGDFSFEDVSLKSRYTLKISSVGFKAYELPVSFFTKPTDGAMQPPSTDKDLGKIKLTPDAKDLQVVTVVSSTPTIKLNADKKIFNVEKNIMSAGGTGVDVMRNVPSVNVDIDGNITMRNAAPQLLVDGRPTTLTLDQIPADAIESVEVISNPSAKYDASGGGAGILNIVLKKNKKTGYNGNVRAGVDKRGAVNGGLDFNVRQNKINISAAVNGNQNKGQTTGTTERISQLTTPQTITAQNNFNKTTGGFLFAKLGVDYFATNKTTLSLSGIKVHGEFNPYELIGVSTDSLYNSGKISAASQRLTTGTREFNGQGLVFGLKHTFAKPGEELTVDANYFGGKNSNNSLYTTNYLTSTGATSSTALQTALGYGSDKNFVIQSDYTLPLSKTAKLETGVRAAIRSRVNVNDNYLYNDSAKQYLIIPSATSNYKNTDNVYAAYATYSNSIKDFSYKVGVRAESSNYTGTLTNTGETFKNSYPVSLFPSVFLSQKLANRQELQFSYSRRVNRPNFFQLIPFTDYTDKLNITRGNPNLVPEFTQSVELSYLKTFQKSSTFLGSLYYKHTDNLITRYLSSETDAVSGNTELINTYINANSSYAAGAEATVLNTLTKWWDISTNVNVYNSKVNTSNVTTTQQAALWSLFGKFNSNFKLPSNFAVQLTTTYQSKTNLPVSQGGGMGGPPMMQSQSSSQGYIKPSWGMDLAVKKSFLKNNAASVSLSVTDIFKTRINSQYSSSDYFTQTYSRLRDPQMFKLNFAYRFGKLDASLFKRKSSGGDSNATESIQQ
ncbi:outer membrane beta-barrel protein [Ferruginibacter sp. SUN106]|uniref:outer membrane beta-barrel protein n=1 Tax=Ferruginibacter sp. SUN106 TaxID=2978348 RepID=UPI003D360E0A